MTGLMLAKKVMMFLMVILGSGLVPMVIPLCHLGLIGIWDDSQGCLQQVDDSSNHCDFVTLTMPQVLETPQVLGKIKIN
jgi:hypothetical protein